MFDKGIFGGALDFNRDGKMDMFERAAEFNFISEMNKDSKLADAGLDRDELEFMDEDERIEALEDAGLDPDDFDF